MKTHVPLIVASGLALSAHAALAGHPHHRAPLSIAVIGDMPYGTSPTDTAQFDASPAFLDAINADRAVSFAIHVGDIHSGKQYCTEAYDRSIFDLWTQLAVPLVYTPGDNEWADCHKKAEGGDVVDTSGNPVDYANGDPIANLELVRQIFFARAGLALGGGVMPVATQSWFYDPRHPDDADYVENVIFEQRGIVFVTIDLPGGSNNDQDVWYGAATESPAQAAERVARTGADQRWLETAFAFARVIRARGVVIVAQADVWDPEKGAAHQTGYEPIVATVANGATQLGAPVLMLNGDSHAFLSDNPLSPSDPLAAMHPGYDVPNFHRIVVHGSTLPLEYLRLTIDGDPAAGVETFGPFSWERVAP